MHGNCTRNPKFPLIAGMLLATGSLYAQTGVIRGTVTTSDGLPAAAVTIQLKEIRTAVQSDADGNFLLNRLAACSYTLVASFVGLPAQVQQIIVKHDDNSVNPIAPRQFGATIACKF